MRPSATAPAQGPGAPPQPPHPPGAGSGDAETRGRHAGAAEGASERALHWLKLEPDFKATKRENPKSRPRREGERGEEGEGRAGRRGRGQRGAGPRSARPGLSAQRGPDPALDGAHLRSGHPAPCLASLPGVWRADAAVPGTARLLPTAPCSGVRTVPGVSPLVPTPTPTSTHVASGQHSPVTHIHFIYMGLSSPGSLTGYTLSFFPAPVKVGFHGLFTIYGFPETSSPFGEEGE